MNLDQDQQRAYLTDMNVVVSAGAGSGKTRVLAERYVRLVTERGFKVHEVLTLTFTRKAASEMRQRIFDRLSESSHPLAKEALMQFDKARISTLDSFCTKLVRGASNRYGLSGDFRVDDMEMRRMAEETAVELVMSGRHDKTLYATLSRLVSARSFEIIIKKLFADIALSSFSLVKQGDYTILAQKQIDFIKKEAQKRCETINNCCSSILSMDISECKSKRAVTAKDAARKMFSLPLVINQETIPFLIERARFFSSQEAFPTIPSKAKDKTLEELKVITDEARENAKKLVALTRTFQFQEDILAFGQLLDGYEADYLSRKRQTGLISFRDTLEMSIDILKSDAKLRFFYKRNIKAVMIDEFQDNNEQQKNLLYLLAEWDKVNTGVAVPVAKDLAPDKLFFVGDEKQSIYSFRGADVTVFRKLSKELKEGAPLQQESCSVSLNTNYRSTPELVDFFNAVFPAIFGVAVEDYEAEFSEVHSNPAKVNTETKHPSVEIFLQESPEDGRASAETSEALAVAERIVQGVRSGEFGFGDIAVLFRSTSHQNEYERVFRQAGIPFTASDPRGVYAEGPANDFYAILRLALFPLDRNAYAAVLRSPFVKLDDEAVFILLLELGADSLIEKKPFPDTPALSFSPAEKARYEHGKSVLTELYRRIDVEPIALILSYLWFETGYRTWLLYHKESRPALGHFDYLYTLALDADRRQLSMGAFLDELAPLIGTAEKTETGDAPQVDDEVLFLTVHKSKGLEFPVVALVDAGSVGKGDRNDKPYYLSADWGPTLNLKLDTAGRNESSVNYFYEMVRDTIKKQEEAEIKRLFYVAATRAEKRLLIFGTRKVTNQEEQILEGLDEMERLSSLAALPHVNNKNEIQKNSFLNLLAIGLASGKSKQHVIFPIFPPASTDVPNSGSIYTERLRVLKEETERIMGKTNVSMSALITPEAFYAKEIPPLAESSLVYTNPTAMEAIWKKNEKISTDAGQGIRGERLPDFKNNDFLDGNEERSMNFGTLCHRLIEQRFTGLGSAFEDAAFHFACDLFPNASREKAQALADEALSLADAFLSSPLGKEAYFAQWRDSEAEFILPLSGGNGKIILVKGQIDLLYEHDGHCIIVDFKTDREVRPENHRLQLACYKAASHAFSDLLPKTVLVFLRNMTAVFFNPEVDDKKLLDVARAAVKEKNAQ
ncbi:MAG: UvrD-helicase domain-containing protein [Treponema sp.]|jgi:ATP-dependent helicase/nuclease subunit A|nr:UvrD-helicase domain-containing protein [Treponema sp.]